MAGRPILQLSGRALPLSGDDIDTDRIYPARFLRTLFFDGIDQHLFADDRLRRCDGSPHPLDDERFRNASLLIVGRNFGCGSSREHAPQAIYRWGFRGIIGESFADIFADNARRLGMACVTLPHNPLRQLLRAVEDDPTIVVEVDIERLEVRYGSTVGSAVLPQTTREMLRSGLWDTMAVLRENSEAVRDVAGRLPYMTGFSNQQNSQKP